MKFKRLIPLALLFIFTSAVIDNTEKFRAGKKLFLKGEINEAETYFKEFLNEQPFEYEIRDALYYMGEIYRMRGDYNNAMSYYNRLNKRYPHSRYRLDLIYLYGECYYHMELISKAVVNLRDYLSSVHDPMEKPWYYINANYLLAKISAQARNWEGAAGYYHKALRILEIRAGAKDSEIPDELAKETLRDIYYSLGWIYAEKLQKPERAHFYLTKSLSFGQELDVGMNFMLRRISIFHLGTENGLPDEAISDIQVDGDDVWISTWGGGLVRFSRSTDSFLSIPLPSNQLRDIYVDFETVYITSYDGIFVFNKKNNTIYPLKKEEIKFDLAQKVFKDDRVVYFSTLSNGVIKYDTIRKTVDILNDTSYIGSKQVYAIEADHRYLAFGTLDHGAIVYDKEKDETHYINVENGLLDGNNVKALLIDGRYLWLGVHKHGIYQYDLVRRKTRFFDWNLPYPSTLAKRGKKIWIGTSGNGLRIYDRESGELRQVTILEGLSSNEVHHLQMEGNYIWIGYLDKGIDILYHPDELPAN